MKTFKTILLIAFFLFSLNSQAQTKEETISWLQEKLTKYIVPYDTSISNISITVSSCEITFDYTIDGKYKWQSTIPTDEVIFKDNMLYTNGERIKRKDITEGTPIRYQKILYNLKLMEGETDLKARVKKALDHLATFCPKKKETF
tara:strand:- start:447 stop:881 length:435 start_codon:yes stop_codon:yes gene_type:complete